VFQSLGEIIVFFLVHVTVGMVQKIAGTMETAVKIESGVNRRVIAQTFAVINRSYLDFIDGTVNFCNDVTALLTDVAIGDISAGEAQIRQGMEIGRMIGTGAKRGCKPEGDDKKKGLEDIIHTRLFLVSVIIKFKEYRFLIKISRNEGWKHGCGIYPQIEGCPVIPKLMPDWNESAVKEE